MKEQAAVPKTHPVAQCTNRYSKRQFNVYRSWEQLVVFQTQQSFPRNTKIVIFNFRNVLTLTTPLKITGPGFFEAPPLEIY